MNIVKKITIATILFVGSMVHTLTWQGCKNTLKEHKESITIIGAVAFGAYMQYCFGPVNLRGMRVALPDAMYESLNNEHRPQAAIVGRIFGNDRRFLKYILPVMDEGMCGSIPPSWNKS